MPTSRVVLQTWDIQPMQTDCYAVHARRTAVLISTLEHKNEVIVLPLAKVTEKRWRGQRQEQLEKKSWKISWWRKHVSASKRDQIVEHHGSTLHSCSSRSLWKRLALQMPLQMRRRTPTISPCLGTDGHQHGVDWLLTAHSWRGCWRLWLDLQRCLFVAVA